VELTVLGGSGAWPRVGQGCSGYLVTHHNYRLLIDPGYGVLGELQRHCDPGAVDAVLISHGHPDHCADLNPLLRARVLGPADHPVLPVLAPLGALDRLLALDPVAAVAQGAELVDLPGGSKINFGPFSVQPAELRHHVTTFGFRISTDDDAVLAYTADSGASPDRVELAQDAGLLLAEVSHPDNVPAEDARYLSNAVQVAELAVAADVERCVITHLMPYADPFHALARVRSAGFDAVEIARPGLARTIRPRPAATRLPRRAVHRPAPETGPAVVPITDSKPRRAASGP
jgi:ribonuclease BN (tRNA processing enzyme)